MSNSIPSKDALKWLDELRPPEHAWRDPDFVLVVSAIMLQGIPRRCGQLLIDAGFGQKYPHIREQNAQ